MTIDQLIRQVGDIGCFDLPMLTQAPDVKRSVLRVQLSRWIKAGKVVGLRRGMYALSSTYRRRPLNRVLLANQLYSPSYLSGLWALGYYDMIPERVVWFTSVTPRVPRHFENQEGVYDYRNIKQSLFFGYGVKHIDNQEVLVADPEKALLDYWHLHSGEWTLPRLRETRYQHGEQVEAERLKDYAHRFDSPRLTRAVDRWLKLRSEEKDGWVTV